MNSDNIAKLFISAIAASGLVFGFDTIEVQSQKYWWFFIFASVLAIRTIDLVYWKINLRPKAFVHNVPLLRFSAGALVTAVLWSSYVVIVAGHAEIIELSYTIIIIAAMAGGAATVLAPSKVTSVCYSSILLFPFSIVLLLSEQEYQRSLGFLGAAFGFVMISTAIRAANFTKNAVHLKNHNYKLMEGMKAEKQEVTRINGMLSNAVEEINQINDSLEKKVVRRTKRIHQLSNLDPLTQLYNRNAFIYALRELLVQSKATNLPLAVLFIDLDGFKQINDALGHTVGDLVLKTITSRLYALKSNGNIGRWGGDEFVLALPGCDEQSAAKYSNKVMACISSTIETKSLKLNVGASIGIALSPEHSDVEHQLIRYADIAMYQQKKRRDKSACVFSSDLLVSLQEKESLREGLQQAIKNNELFLTYQPIVDSQSKSINSCEVLLRWSFNQQLVPPTIFIEIAEQSGSIIEIGHWVLKRACLDAANWTNADDCKISINVSVVQLMDSSFIGYLDEALKESQLQPERLILEITESTIAENRDHIKTLLERIKSRHVNLSIDDFGTGYSSMYQLQTLPFDIIKIDRSFVTRLDKKGAAIVKAILMLAKELGCITVAEGVETESQELALRNLGVDYMQGFLFAKPMRELALLDFIDASSVKRQASV